MALFQFLWTMLFVTSRFFFLKYTRFTEWFFLFLFFHMIVG